MGWGMKKIFFAVFVSVFVLPMAWAELVADPDRIDFDGVAVGQDEEETIELINDGDRMIYDIEIDVVHNRHVFSYFDNCPDKLFPGDSCDVDVRFEPNQKKKYRDELDVDYRDGGSHEQLWIDLEGEGL